MYMQQSHKHSCVTVIVPKHKYVTLFNEHYERKAYRMSHNYDTFVVLARRWQTQDLNLDHKGITIQHRRTVLYIHVLIPSIRTNEISCLFDVCKCRFHRLLLRVSIIEWSFPIFGFFCITSRPRTWQKTRPYIGKYGMFRILVGKVAGVESWLEIGHLQSPTFKTSATLFADTTL